MKIRQERQVKHTPTNMNPKAPKFPQVPAQRVSVKLPTNGYSPITGGRTSGMY